MANSDTNKLGAATAYSEADRYAPDTTAPKIIYRLGDLAEALGKDAEARYGARQNGQPLGIVTGIKQLDNLLGGALWPGLHCIQGDPGIGKTAFALQVACDCGGVGVFVTCEMSPLEILRRVIARTCNVPMSALTNGTLTRLRIMEYAQAAAAAAPGLIILDATAVPVSADFIYKIAYTHSKAAGERCMVAIDSLHSWQTVSSGPTEYDRLADCLDSLKKLSARLNAPVLYISERNRESSKKGGGLSGGAGHRQIEYSAGNHHRIKQGERHPDITPTRD